MSEVRLLQPIDWVHLSSGASGEHGRYVRRELITQIRYETDERGIVSHLVLADGTEHRTRQHPANFILFDLFETVESEEGENE